MPNSAEYPTMDERRLVADDLTYIVTHLTRLARQIHRLNLPGYTCVQDSRRHLAGCARDIRRVIS